MTDVRFDVQWQEADEVSSKELAATWARFALYVGDECLTVVEDSLSDSYRSTLDVSMYPLAEWVAFNWWFLTTPNAGGRRASAAGAKTIYERHCLSAAADGFPWPPLFLFPEENCFLAAQTPRRSSSQRVNFVRSGRYLLDFESTIYALERFIDTVVRRLEDQGVCDSRLQREWDSIQSAPSDEIEFCRAAALMGQDPYSIDAALAEALVEADASVGSSDLFLEMLPAIGFPQLGLGVEWLVSSLHVLEAEQPILTGDDLLRVVKGVRRTAASAISPVAPWQAGYERARIVRASMDLDPLNDLDMDPFVAVGHVDEQSPGALEALARAERSIAVAVVSKQRTSESTRFIQARTLSRAVFAERQGPQVISHGSGLRDRAERAFAAELLAPARGLETFLNGDLSEAAQSAAAQHFHVDRLVIEHQVDNQLNWSADAL
jgi:hypothetical protein